MAFVTHMVGVEECQQPFFGEAFHEDFPFIMTPQILRPSEEWTYLGMSLKWYFFLISYLLLKLIIAALRMDLIVYAFFSVLLYYCNQIKSIQIKCMKIRQILCRQPNLYCNRTKNPTHSNNGWHVTDKAENMFKF